LLGIPAQQPAAQYLHSASQCRNRVAAYISSWRKKKADALRADWR
jgi:hypothetical protein